MNDDMFFGAPIARSDILDSEGRIRVYVDPVATLFDLGWMAPPGPSAMSLVHTAKLFQDMFPEFRAFRVMHQGTTLTKSNHEMLHTMFAAEVNRTATQKFRKVGQFVPVTASAMLSSIRGDACISFARSSQLLIKMMCDKCDKERLASLVGPLSPRPKWLCVNDHCNSEGASHVILKGVLDELFPFPAEWERRP
eukprot:m51a1_g13596 hypothetical protein (194) ;mRNA; f:490-1179